MAVNDRFLKLMGYKRDEILQLTTIQSKVWNNEEEWESFLHQLQEQRYIENFEAELRTKSGKLFPSLVSSVRISFRGEKCVLTVVRDMTEHKKEAEQNRQLVAERQRMDVLHDFIRNASHDLRTPLASLQTRLYLIEKTKDPEQQQRHLNLMQQRITHLTEMIESMFMIARLDATNHLNQVPILLYKILHDACVDNQPLAEMRKVSVTYDPAFSDLTVSADQPKLQMAFTHLIKNAILYNKAEGSVTIQVEEREEIVQIEVQDNGIGIKKTDLSRIFQPFFKTDEARSTDLSTGNGLGLAIVHRIIKLHNGTIEMESTSGVGSCFRVKLPRLMPESADSVVQSSTNP